MSFLERKRWDLMAMEKWLKKSALDGDLDFWRAVWKDLVDHSRKCLTSWRAWVFLAFFSEVLDASSPTKIQGTKWRSKTKIPKLRFEGEGLDRPTNNSLGAEACEVIFRPDLKVAHRRFCRHSNLALSPNWSWTFGVNSLCPLWKKVRPTSLSYTVSPIYLF